MGNLLAVVVHAANIHDTKSGILPAREAVKKYPSIKRFCANAGYRKSFVDAVQEEFDLGVDISEKIKPHEWERLPWRWIVGLKNKPCKWICRRKIWEYSQSSQTGQR